MKDGQSDMLLINKIQEGSPLQRTAAQSTLYDKYRAAVRNYLQSRLPPSAVEDLDQTVWTAIIEGSLTVGLESGDARNWIIGIAHKKVADYYRNQKKSSEHAVSHVVDRKRRIPKMVERRESIIELRKAWRALTPEQRLVIFLSDILGVPVREVIRWIGRPKQTVYSIRHRAKRALREHLKRQRDGLEPDSPWLIPDPHHYIVGDLHPHFSQPEACALSKKLGVSPTELESKYEFGFTLYIHPSEEYLDVIDYGETLFQLVLLPRESWDNLIEKETRQASLVSFPMVFEGETLTIATAPSPSHVEIGWGEEGRLQVTRVEKSDCISL